MPWWTQQQYTDLERHIPCVFFKPRTETHSLTLWRSRDQPSLGPAVARTPPLLNSPSGRLSSRLNVVDWLLFNLKWWQHIYKIHPLYKKMSKRKAIKIFLQENLKQNNVISGLHSLSKQFLYSFIFLLAVWGCGERVCAVAVGGSLR